MRPLSWLLGKTSPIILEGRVQCNPMALADTRGYSARDLLFPKSSGASNCLSPVSPILVLKQGTPNLTHFPQPTESYESEIPTESPSVPFFQRQTQMDLERTNTEQKDLIRRLEMELDDMKVRLDHSQHREMDLESINDDLEHRLEALAKESAVLEEEHAKKVSGLEENIATMVQQKSDDEKRLNLEILRRQRTEETLRRVEKELYRIHQQKHEILQHARGIQGQGPGNLVRRGNLPTPVDVPRVRKKRSTSQKGPPSAHNDCSSAVDIRVSNGERARSSSALVNSPSVAGSMSSQPGLRMSSYRWEEQGQFVSSIRHGNSLSSLAAAATAAAAAGDVSGLTPRSSFSEASSGSGGKREGGSSKIRLQPVPVPEDGYGSPSGSHSSSQGSRSRRNKKVAKDSTPVRQGKVAQAMSSFFGF